MKKMSLLLAVILAAVSFAGCGGGALDAEESTVYVQKKGKVTEITVENFGKDYYDAEELEQYIHSMVDNYNDQYGDKSIEINSFSSEGGEVKLNIDYASCEDYAAMRNVVLFAGSIPEAQAAGYDFDAEFLFAADGVLGEKVDKDIVLLDTDCKVIITNEKINVKVDGKVQYVSEKYTGLSGKDTVTVRLPEDARDGEELALVYIIYK